MLTVLAVLLAAAPVKVASTGWSSVRMPGDVANFYAEHFSIALGKHPELEVTTPKTIAGMLGLERQRELLGCGEASQSCMAELAAALGADVLVVGEAAKLESSLQVNARIVDAKSGKTLHAFGRREKNEEALLDALEVEARSSARAILAALRPGEAPAAVKAAQEPPLAVRSARSGGGVGKGPLITLGAGLAGVGVGAILLLSNLETWQVLNGEKPLPDRPGYEVYVEAERAQGRQAAGAVIGGLGVAAMTVGALWVVLGRTDGPVAMVTGDGASLGWAGVLP